MLGRGSLRSTSSKVMISCSCESTEKRAEGEGVALPLGVYGRGEMLEMDCRSPARSPMVEPGVGERTSRRVAWSLSIDVRAEGA